MDKKFLDEKIEAMKAWEYELDELVAKVYNNIVDLKTLKRKATLWRENLEKNNT